MKRFFRVVLLLMVCYLLTLLLLYLFQEKFIFRSSQLDIDYQFELSRPYEEIWLKNDKAVLNALMIKSDSSKGVILYFHGNMDDLSRWGAIVEPLTRFNYDVFILDYRQYGKSTGKRSASLMYEDAILAYDYLSGFYEAEQIVIYGRSLGSTFATYVAAHRTADRVILETPFYSLESLVDNFYPFLPSQYILRYKFPSYQFIAQVDEPITFFQGNADLVVPYENAKALFESSGNANWIHVEGAGHNDISNYNIYWEKLEEIL